jgi:lipid II:glycine glycyltransferase (peptidoglycan interpeptide bridge formation enzyme)
MSEMADARGWVTDFCRLNPFTHTPFTKQYDNHASNHVYVDFTRGYERIRKEYRPSARRDVKRANESRVELRPLANEAEHLSFADLYRIRMVELGASLRYCFDYAYLAALNRNLGHHCLTVGAFVDGRLAGASLSLRGNGYMFAYVAAVDTAYRRFSPSHGLHDLAIRIGLRDGYKAYVLGGGLSGEDSVYSYKKSLSPAVFSQLRLNIVLDRERYEQLCAQCAVQEETTDFFPPYRQEKADNHAA